MRSALLIAAFVLLAASPAAARQDLRMPDTRDAATRFAERTVTVPGFPYPTPSQPRELRQDLRSPDTRDFAAGRGTFSVPDVTVVRLPQPGPAPAPARGFDWGDAGMGAAIVFVLAVASAAAVAVQRRRHPALSR